MRLGFVGLLVASLLLAGCAALPRDPLPARQQIRDFALDARFALRVTLPGVPAQSSGGRLSWEHKKEGDHVLVANPLGVGLAEIDMTPALSRLRTFDGKEQESTDPDALIEAVTGQRLPVSRLSDWLLGQAGRAEQLLVDARGRPVRLLEAGWQVDYVYESEAPGALPMRLVLSRNGEIELRLRIEEWKDAP